MANPANTKFKLVEGKNKFNDLNQHWDAYRGLPRYFIMSDVASLFVSKTLKKKLSTLKPNTFLRVGKLSSCTDVFVVVDDGQTAEMTWGPNILRREIRKLNAQILELTEKRKAYLDECVRRGINAPRL